jgi:hypothetical protein
VSWQKSKPLCVATVNRNEKWNCDSKKYAIRAGAGTLTLVATQTLDGLISQPAIRTFVVVNSNSTK